MRMLSLFAGIGGFDLAAQQVWGEGTTVAFCEIDPFCQQVLKKHWPGVPIFSDIRTLGVEQLEQLGAIDIITGGFPCQPFSVAGQRRGTEDDRHLWPEMLRVISIVRPRWVIAENVAGFVSMVQFDSVPPVDDQGAAIGEVGDVYTRLGRGVCNEAVASLEAEGYTVQPLIIPACGVGAPHRRDRVWIVANAGLCGRKRQENEGEQQGRTDAFRADQADSLAPHAQNLHDRGHIGEPAERQIPESGSGIDPGVTADASLQLLHGRGPTRGRRGEPTDGDSRVGTNTTEQRLQGCNPTGARYERRDTEHAGWDEHWLEVAARLCRVDDGLPVELDGFKLSAAGHRRERLKSLGNAIVPAVAEQIMRAIKQVEEVG